ncbi:MAG: ribosome maturation factor RimP [Myxococcota bacterium]
MAKKRRKRKSQFLDEESSADTSAKRSYRLTDDLEEQVEAWAEESAQAHGLVLFDVETLQRGRWIFRIYVDKPGKIVPGESGVDVDDCADVSRYIEAYMDADDRIPEAYVLEVSSPGVERELKKPKHLEQAQGERVQLVVREQVDGKNKLIGTLLSFDDGILTVELDEADEPVEIDWDIVKKAQLKYDFDF